MRRGGRSVPAHSQQFEALVATRTQELRDANAALQQVVALFDPARTEIIMQEMRASCANATHAWQTLPRKGSLLRHVPLVAVCWSCARVAG